MKTSLKTILAAATAFAFVASSALAGPFHSVVLTAQTDIVVPANKVLTILHFTQNFSESGSRATIQVTIDGVLTYPLVATVGAGAGVEAPPVVKDLVIAGPATVTVLPAINSPSMYLCYKLSAN